MAVLISLIDEEVRSFCIAVNGRISLLQTINQQEVLVSNLVQLGCWPLHVSYLFRFLAYLLMRLQIWARALEHIYETVLFFKGVVIGGKNEGKCNFEGMHFGPLFDEPRA